jgi:Ca2+-transporting ATPase
MRWHTQSIETVLENLGTNRKGLNQVDAVARIKQYGLNKLRTVERRTALIILLEQFKSILVFLLIIATIISLYLGLFVDAIAIAIILILNAFLGFYQEFKAERAINALKKLIVSKVVVIRNGEHHEISVESLVPGDIILLEEGNRIPADIRLIEVSNLKINESELTGESVPVTKDVNVLKDVPVADRKNMAFMGTLISYGRGKGVVVATGMSTEMGKIASEVEKIEEPTPLQIKLQHFGKDIGIFVLVIAFFVFLIGIMKKVEIFDMFLTAMSLAISAVPEGLPAVVTLTLTLGAQRMLKRNSVVKRLAAVEALGSVTVICADKTGTMTTNEMTVEKIWCSDKMIDVTGVGFEPKGDFLLNKKRIDSKKDECLELLLKISKMCNDSILKPVGGWHIIGDPTEGALKVLAKKAGIEEDYPRIKEIPFSSERKIMTTIHDIEGEYFAYAKGAPEVILRVCNKIYPNKKFDEKYKEKVLKTIHQLADDGLRVLGFAYKGLDSKYSISNVESDMIFVGLAAMMDPPRKETADAIRVCEEAGIRVIMLTGDHQITAKAIAHEIGLDGDVITGEELDKFDEKELESAVDSVNIFARVSPQHKLKIVETLIKKGNIVAVTGDGVNDAPALKKAEIGVAMGIKGTDVAKESSDMIIMDDNFHTIVSAIEEGRRIYDNIKKFIRFLLSSNFDEMFVVTAAMFLGLPLPFLPLQILWINLITDSFPALSLGVDPKEKDIMQRKPRDPKETFLHSSIPFIIFAGFIGFIVVFLLFWLELPNGLAKARTMAFTTIIMFQLFFVFNCRSEKRSTFKINPFTNKKLIISVLFSIVLQIIIIYIPFFQLIFDTVPLNIFDWLKILLFSSLGLFILPEVFMKKTFRSIDYIA